MYQQGSKSKNGNIENPVDVNQVTDVWEIYQTHPFIKRSRDAFVSMVLHTAPEVELTKMNMVSDDELNGIMKLFWLPWLEKLYDWIKMFGVCPWYFRRIRTTGHLIPTVPPFGSGRITTSLTDKHEQDFHWYWNNASEPDRKMYFERGAHVPSLNGKLTSPIASLLKDWQTERVVRQSTELIAYQQAHQQHIIEHHPPKITYGDDNITSLEGFGEKIAGDVMMMQERMQQAKMTVRSDALHSAIRNTLASNKVQHKLHGTGPFLQSEKQGERWERENSNLLDHAITLKPDFVYKGVNAPKCDFKLETFAQRLDSLAAGIMDIPLQMTESSGRLAVNMTGIMRVVNERLRFWVHFFELATKKAFVLAYGDTINAELMRRPQKQLDWFAHDEVTVRIVTTPLATYDELKKVYDEGLYDKPTFASHAFTILGLPQDDIFITEPVEEEEQVKPPKKR